MENKKTSTHKQKFSKKGKHKNSPIEKNNKTKKTHNNSSVKTNLNKKPKKTEKTMNYSYSIDKEEVKINKIQSIKSFFKRNFNNKFKNLNIKYKQDPKKKIALVIALVALLSTVIGSSYAYLTYSSKTNNSAVIKAGTLALVFKNSSNSIVLNGAIPQSDEEGLSNQNEYEFTIENTGNIPATYNITLDNTCSTSKSYTIDQSTVTPTLCIPNEHIKVAIKEGDNDYKVLEKKTKNDETSYILDSDSLKPDVTRTYKMKIWLDYDTPNDYNSSHGKVVVYAGKLGLNYEQGSFDKDESGANKPELLDGMIPVYFDTTSETWKKADENSTTGVYRWYNYSKKVWANSVTVTETNRSKYESAKAGTEIPMSDILTMQVWIPRYKYKVWNYNADGTSTSSPSTIEITFENAREKTGEITCTDSLKTTAANQSQTCKLASATCTNSLCNGKTYTHPAFTFGNTELRGIWVGKFELTGTIDSITTKPNLSSLRSQKISTYETNIMNMSKSANAYGLATDTDAHMIKNTEWGAVAYLSHSEYGTNKNIGINNYADYTTGCGDTNGSTITGTCNEYNTKKGTYASTSGNVYGVYDMSGGAFEYTMSNILSTSSSSMMTGNSTDNNSGYTGMIGTTSYSAAAYPSAKYIDKYSYGTSGSERIRSKLGDGIKEVYNEPKYGWYSDYSALANNTNPWFVRGGGYCLENDCAGIFNSDAYYGSANQKISTRFVMVK